MLDKLSEEEKTKIIDFMTIFREYLNPKHLSDINEVIDYVIDEIVKVYLDYKDIIPSVSVEDDLYSFYIIKPKNGKYSLLDYLINTVIQNLDSIEFVQGNVHSNYNMLKKKIIICKNNIMSLHDSVFDIIRKKINKKEYLKLFFKSALYHEIGHMLHYKIDEVLDNTVYVPADYLSLSSFPPLRVFMSKRAKEEELARRKKIVKEQARDRIRYRVSIYGCLKSKYDILSVDEIDNANIDVENKKIRYEEVCLPPFLYINPVDEAFTECDAQMYSGLFENEIFENNENGELECFYLPLDDEHILMTYSPTHYAFSASIGFAIKRCVSKESYFRTVFLRKNDLFLEFLGNYEQAPVSLLSRQLIEADKYNMASTQPLLDYIVDYRKSKNRSLDLLNIFFPLVYKNGEWLYYTEALDKGTPAVLKKESENKNNNVLK